MTANKRAIQRIFPPRPMKMAIPPSKGRCERIQETPGTCPPSNEGGLQGGHWKSSPSFDSTGATPLRSPLGQGGTSPRATSFSKDSRMLSHLQGAEGNVPMVNIPLQTRRTPPYAPLDRGDLQLLRDKSINPRGTSLAQEGQSLLEFAIVLPL